MLRPIAALLVVALSGCASQPHAAIPPSSDNEPSVMAPPEPEATTTATDIAMFAERLRQVVAVVVAGFLSPDYKDTE
jgi:ABC-type phosphate/phosphonate transport system substrate-binding protein